MALYKLKKKVGKHVDVNGKVYGPGDTVESESDLTLSFPLKFDLVQETLVNAPPSKPEIPVPVSDVDGPPTSTSEEEVFEYGEDVSDQFEDASIAELRVYKKRQWFTIVDPDDGTVMSEKKLRLKDVAPFLAKYVEPSEE